MSNNNENLHPDIDIVVQETRPEVKKPPMYKVILQNDDYTPMDFVVHVLMDFFNKNESQSVRIMLEVHEKGQGLCGVYSRDIAETKVAQVNDYSRQCHHPLLCTLEVES